MFSSEALRASGFDGFVTWAEFSPGMVADIGGVYIVLRSTDIAPSFEAVSCGGHFKGRNPAVGLDQLRAKWVSGTETVYIGKAASLRTRLRQYRAFGLGRAVGHWGGRYIWQLTEPLQLQVCWKATDEPPETVESALLRSFTTQHGSLPFANLRN